MKTLEWPVLTRYDQKHLYRLAMPIGGIGTGTVSLGGRGDLRDWEIVNRPAKGFKPRQSFFTLYTKLKGGEATAHALEGVLDPHDYEGAFGSTMPNHGLPRFRKCHFEAAYPFGQVLLSDPAVPLEVRLQAFNPLVPGDADRSSMPVAALRFVLTNKTATPIEAAVCGNLENFIGQDGHVVVDSRINTGVKGGAQNKNAFRESEGLRGLFMSSGGINPDAEQWGTLALVTTAQAGVTHRTNWADVNWGDSLLDYWDDFASDGKLAEREANVDNPIGSLAVSVTVPPRSSKAITFLLTWHFPNRPGWGVRNEPTLSYGTGTRDVPERAGNYYTTQFRDAWEVAERVAAQLPQLESDTLKFVNAFLKSDMPDAVKEAALYNASTLRTQTAFRIESGELMGWEGCGDKAGCCFGSCTHVWNYEQATAFLFGGLSKTMREIEFKHSTRSDGLICFRADLPLNHATEWINAAADGQMGCLMKLYRDWQLSGDDAMLRELWPNAKRALQFCWRPGGWDADEDGVMEGCQHNTMDVEYYGPNPEMGTWYLGALRATEEMARYLGEAEFADKCRRLFASGSQWMDAHLFNGEYYEHEVRPPKPNELILDGLRVGMGANDLSEPDLQLGAGCLVDQLVGQTFAHVCGLGYLLNQKNVQATLRAIMKHNFKRGFSTHFNHLRSFVLGDESALLIATYPRGCRPKRPFPYYNEAWTGLEYTAAAHMFYEDQKQPGLKVIKAVRDRYDGLRRNPFDEAECGHHYARAMASWAAVLALSGFTYSAVNQSIAFANFEGTYFWSNGYAWGLCEQASSREGNTLKITVLHGELRVRRVEVREVGAVTLAKPVLVTAGKSLQVKLCNYSATGVVIPNLSPRR